MKEQNVSMKLKIICAVLTLCMVLSIVSTFSKAGVAPVTKDDVIDSDDKQNINTEIDYYNISCGDIVDRHETPIQENSASGEAGGVHDCFGMLVGYYDPDYGSYGLKGDNKDIMYREYKKTGKGLSLKLTIDSDLQEFVYNEFAGRDASVVILERGSGRLLSLVSTDSQADFNPANIYDSDAMNTYNSIKNFWLPKYTQDAAGGSVMKVFTAAVMNELGLEDFVYDDATGEIYYPEGKIKNCSGEAFGVIGLSEGFVHSANTYFAKAAEKIGRYRLNMYAEKMCFNRDIECDFATISPVYDTGNSSFDIGSAGYGQGKTLHSTVSLAMMMQAICDRNLYLPHVIDSTFYYGKDGIKTVDSTKETIISKNVVTRDTAKAVDELMLAASESYGISRELGIRSKTGTAEIEEEGIVTGRATFLSYSDKYIVAVSEHYTDTVFGASLIEETENIYRFMAEYNI